MIKALPMKNLEQERKTRKLLNTVNQRLLAVQVLHGGWIMKPEVLRIVLREHPQLDNEWKILQGRKFKLERNLWKVT